MFVSRNSFLYYASSMFVRSGRIGNAGMCKPLFILTYIERSVGTFSFNTKDKTWITSFKVLNRTGIKDTPIALLLPPICETEQSVTIFADWGKLSVRRYA